MWHKRDMDVPRTRHGHDVAQVTWSIPCVPIPGRSSFFDPYSEFRKRIDPDVVCIWNRPVACTGGARTPDRLRRPRTGRCCISPPHLVVSYISWGLVFQRKLFLGYTGRGSLCILICHWAYKCRPGMLILRNSARWICVHKLRRGQQWLRPLGTFSSVCLRYIPAQKRTVQYWRTCLLPEFCKHFPRRKGHLGTPRMDQSRICLLGPWAYCISICSPFQHRKGPWHMRRDCLCRIPVCQFCTCRVHKPIVRCILFLRCNALQYRHGPNLWRLERTVLRRARWIANFVQPLRGV